MVGMEERIRITFDVTDRVRRALNICAARRDIAVGRVIEELVEQGLPDDIHLADEAISSGSDGGKPKRGRRPKTKDD